MDMLGQSTLRDAHGKEFPASQIWANQPAVVLVLRRPGCVLCRDEAKKLWSLHSQVEALGVNMVTVVHEWREREITAFAPEYWGGPVYHDLSKSFYKAVNGGELLHGSAKGLLNPFSATWKRIMEARKNVSSHNVVGEGLIMGGLMVVGAGGTGPFFTHVESDLGVHASHTEVMEAVRQAAAAAKGQEQGQQTAMSQMPMAHHVHAVAAQ